MLDAHRTNLVRPITLLLYTNINNYMIYLSIYVTDATNKVESPISNRITVMGKIH